MEIHSIPSTEAAAKNRRRNVESVLGSLRIEGLEVDPHTHSLMNRYVDGELTVDEVMAKILALR